MLDPSENQNEFKIYQFLKNHDKLQNLKMGQNKFSFESKDPEIPYEIVSSLKQNLNSNIEFSSMF